MYIQQLKVIIDKQYKIKKFFNTLYRGIDLKNEHIRVFQNNKDNVVTQIENVSSISEETASATEEVSASTEEITATMNEFTQYAVQLQQLSEKLENEINKFIIES